MQVMKNDTEIYSGSTTGLRPLCNCIKQLHKITKYTNESPSSSNKTSKRSRNERLKMNDPNLQCRIPTINDLTIPICSMETSRVIMRSTLTELIAVLWTSERDRFERFFNKRKDSTIRASRSLNNGGRNLNSSPPQ